MKKIMKKIILIVLIGASAIAKAQIDPHFSQYYMHPLWLNPALTGAINGDYRVAAIDRNQWSSVTNAFSTQGLTGDITTNKNINFGLSLLQETAGDAGYKYFNGLGSVSYSGIKFGKEGLKVISFGMNAGIVNRRFDFSKLQGGDQFTPYLGFDPSKLLNESFVKSSSTDLDLGAGIAYYDGDPDKQINFFGGFSATHLNQPKDEFYATSSANAKVPVRYALHGGARVLLSDRASIVPNAVIIQEGGSREMMLGGYWQQTVTDDVDLMAGLNYRIGDALYPYLGLNFNNLIIGLSYDINASQLGEGAKGASSYEFSLMYTNKKGTDKGYFKCPRF
jgi:type IX secretion system PorP/SprF family membrane protein